MTALPVGKASTADVNVVDWFLAALEARHVRVVTEEAALLAALSSPVPFYAHKEDPR